MEEAGKDRTRRQRSPFGLVIIVAGLIALAIVLILLARAPGMGPARGRVGYTPPPVLGAVNPADADAIAVLKSALESEDPQTVMKAASRTPYLAIPELKEALKGLRDRGLLWDYIRALPELHHLGDQDALKDLQRYLASADLQTVMSALEALERMPPLSCRDELLAALREPHMDMAIGGSKVLRAWRRSDEEINQVLLNIMRKAPVDFSQVAAAAALYDLGVEKEEAWEKIEYWCENSDMDLAPSLVTFLKYCGDPRAAPTIATLLKNPSTRPHALAGLIGFNWPGKLELIGEIEDELVNTYEKYLVMINREVSAGRSDLGKTLASLLEESPPEQPAAPPGEGPPGAPGTPGKPPRQLEMEASMAREARVGELAAVLQALKEWDSPRVIPFLEQIVSMDARVLRMDTSRALRRFPNNRRAINLARQMLESAADERERREHATTLGYIDNGHSVARLHELMFQAEEPETKLTIAWAILNINRHHPHRYPQR